MESRSLQNILFLRLQIGEEEEEEEEEKNNRQI